MNTRNEQQPQGPGPEDIVIDGVNHKLKIGIVGHGFVGQAVDYAFTHAAVEKFYVDPKHNTTIDDLIDWQPNITFICAPTPMSDSGFVDASIVEDATLKVIEHTKGGVVIKSTITPDVVDRLYCSLFEDDIKRLTINPEFLTENNAKMDFVNAKYHVIGGHPDACEALANIYNIFSMCQASEFILVSGPEAAFVKYATNSYLAMKLTFFNQLHDSIEKFGCNSPVIINAICKDERIGFSHTRVPGPDGKQGYGGACFPKDTKAFVMFDKDLTLIDKCVSINNEYRKQYDLDEREIAQNVNYGQTEEKQ